MTERRLYFILVAALILFAGVSRLYDLRADPPAYFAGGSQDLTTDGACLTLHARNAALTGEWNPLGYEHWEEFKISLVSGVAYLVFKFAGISLFTGNLVGVILNLAALILFMIALSRYVLPRTLFIVAFLLTTDYLLWLFGRLPFSENAVLFFAAVTFFVFTFWYERTWGKLLIGALVACCGLFGKSFGFLIIAGPLSYLMIERKSDFWKSLVLLLCPLGFGLVMYSMLVSGESGLFAFVWLHAAGEHGYPYGLLSPVHYFEKLVTFANNDLFAYALVPGILAFIFLVRTLISPEKNEPQKKLISYMGGWIVIWIIVIAPFNYLPVRYMYILLIPMCALAALEIEWIGRPGLRRPAKLTWWQLSGLMLLNWIFMYYVAVYPFKKGISPQNIFHAAWIALPLGFALIAIELWLFRRKKVIVPLRFQSIAIALVLIAALGVNARQYYKWYSARTYAINEAASEMPQLIGPGAVLAGQYGPALACNSTLGSFPLFLGTDPNTYKQILRQNAVTHIAVSEVDWNRLTANNPALSECPVIARYWIRDKVVCVMRINRAFGNQQAMRYDNSEFETALDFWDAGDRDSCCSHLGKALLSNPRGKTALMTKYYFTVDPHNLWPCRAIVDTLVTAYPTDMSVRILASVYYRSLNGQSPNAQLFHLAQEHLAQALRYAPQNEKGIRDACKNAQPEQWIL